MIKPMTAVVAALAGVATLAVAPMASAVTFAWSYTGITATILAGGTLTATPLGGGVYAVTSISGLRNGAAVTGLTTYASDDNRVYTTFPQVDYPGLAYTDSGGFAYNVYYDGSTTDAYSCGAVGYCEIGPGVVGSSGLGPPPDAINQVVFLLTPVPEPSTWAMMLLGLGGLGLALRQARRRPAATPA